MTPAHLGSDQEAAGSADLHLHRTNLNHCFFGVAEPQMKSGVRTALGDYRGAKASISSGALVCTFVIRHQSLSVSASV